MRLILGVEVGGSTSEEDGVRRGSLAPVWEVEAESILDALAVLHLELGGVLHARLPETVDVPWTPVPGTREQIVTPPSPWTPVPYFPGGGTADAPPVVPTVTCCNGPQE